MPEYRVFYERTITDVLIIDVFADSPEDAITRTYNEDIFKKGDDWVVTKPGLVTQVGSIRKDLLNWRS